MASLGTLAAPSTTPPQNEERLVAATLACIARWGLAKTTLDDVAREAGCSRATVYRTFPGGKEALVAAVVGAELDRVYRELDAATAAAGSLGELLVSGLTEAARLARSHEPLRFLLSHEPEAVLPWLSFGQMNRVLAAVTAFAAPHLGRFLPPESAARTAEWVTRIFFSYALNPSPHVDLTDRDAVSRFVRVFLMPALAAESVS